MEPGGRAFLHPAEYLPGPETPSDEFPLLLTTGRTVYQFHTRTKTGRVPQLHDAAPAVWAELSGSDARDLGVEEGDVVRITSARGSIEAPTRISGIRSGVVFVPFHYGYWDASDGAEAAPASPSTAANELTQSSWDPVSKQPMFKVAAVRVEKVASGGHRPAPAPTVGGPAPLDADSVPPTTGGESASAASRSGADESSSGRQG
jgi:anaerobic selenocysteine-containing dehydrogenase